MEDGNGDGTEDGGGDEDGERGCETGTENRAENVDGGRFRRQGWRTGLRDESDEQGRIVPVK